MGRRRDCACCNLYMALYFHMGLYICFARCLSILS